MKSHNFMRIAEGLAVEPLLARLRAAPALWDESTARSNYPGSAHRMAQQIILRWAREQTIDAAFRELEAVDYPAAQALMPEASDLFLDLLDVIGEAGDLGRVMLTRLPPDAMIEPHVDEGLYADHYDRFHVCLQAGEGSYFYGGNEVVEMRPGEAWWFNHKREHSVVNHGGFDRIHLIVDVVAPSYRARRGVTFQLEAVPDCWAEMCELFGEHYQEIAFYKDIALEPDAGVYERLAAAGAIRVYTVRDGGNLVGYAMFLVRPNPHYRSSLTAVQDVLYLKPAYRRGRTGVTLIRVAETRLRAEGVQVVYHHVKRSNKVGRLLARMGYELVDEVYAKRLDKKKKGE